MSFPGVTRGDALQRLTAMFKAAGLETPDLDARLLLAHVLGIDRLQILTERDRTIPASLAPQLELAAVRRLKREPVSRIIGERWFYGRPFKITPATLDPRADSETLIEAALALAGEMSPTAPLRILDIGTGSGCLLLTLLAERPDAVGVGTDVSPAALETAKDNQTRLKIAPAAWRLGADFAPVRGETFHLIVSNPPYIPKADIERLDPDVQHFDPHLALDGGEDGLDVYRRLATQVNPYLPAGWIIFEVGVDQAEAVAGLLRSAFGPAKSTVRVFKDLAGVDRCVAASPR